MKQQQSGLWKHGLLLTLLFGFTVMVVGGVMMYRSRAPIPDRVAGPDGATLFTAADIQQGQDLFRKRGLMDYGTVLGHGAYLGPDYTAEALHWMTGAMRLAKAPGYDTLGTGAKAAVDAEVVEEIKTNRYANGVLVFTAGQVAGWNSIVERYNKLFVEGQLERALPKGALLPATEGGGAPANDLAASRQLAAFVTWTAWLSAAKRPEADHSYTNNWPYDKAAGNTATAGSMMWSAASVAGLILFLALILFFQHRYRLTAEDVPNPSYRFELARMPLTASQRATAKYFVIALLLFLVQCLLGGKMAHDYVDGASFYGFNLSQYLPFNIARTWHLQLAIFWIATAWLGMGIFIAPLVSGREPKGQRALVNILFGALVVVVAGSLAGEYLSIKGLLGKMWWWFGTQGWEYLELGRLWMILLIAGMAIWLFIVARGLRSALKAESDRGGLTHLLLYSAAAIPVFYCFGLHGEPRQPHHHGRLLALVAHSPLGGRHVRSLRRGGDRLPDGAARPGHRPLHIARDLLPAHHPAGQRDHRHRPSLLLDRRAGSLDRARRRVLRSGSDSAFAAHGGSLRAIQGHPRRRPRVPVQSRLLVPGGYRLLESVRRGRSRAS